MGSISARSPSSTIAPAARMELDLAFDLFTKGAIYSPRARSGLVCVFFFMIRTTFQYQYLGNPEQAEGEDRSDSNTVLQQ